jgi:hypothetical protein
MTLRHETGLIFSVADQNLTTICNNATTTEPGHPEQRYSHFANAQQHSADPPP